MNKPIYVGGGNQKVIDLLDSAKNAYRIIELLRMGRYEKLFKLTEDDFAYYVDYIGK